MNDQERKIANVDPADIAKMLGGGTKQARAVVFASVNGRDNWHPLTPAEVPAWVKNDPKIMGRLLAGEQCMDTANGYRGAIVVPVEGTGGVWYRAQKVEMTH